MQLQAQVTYFCVLLTMTNWHLRFRRYVHVTYFMCYTKVFHLSNYQLCKRIPKCETIKEFLSSCFKFKVNSDLFCNKIWTKYIFDSAFIVHFVNIVSVILKMTFCHHKIFNCNNLISWYDNTNSPMIIADKVKFPFDNLTYHSFTHRYHHHHPPTRCLLLMTTFMSAAVVTLNWNQLILIQRIVFVWEKL